MEIPGHNYFLFGPYLIRIDVHESLCNKLLEDGKKLKTSHSPFLAGKIKKQLAYYNNFKYYQKEFQPYINSWINGWYRQLGCQPKIKGKLTSLWINFQKAGEHNPIHMHTNADLSFALYLNAPIEMINEKDESQGLDPGRISFIYGEDRVHTISERPFTPKKNTMFMFPANLRHYVSSFKSNVERISVAGNIKFENATKQKR